MSGSKLSTRGLKAFARGFLGPAFVAERVTTAPVLECKDHGHTFVGGVDCAPCVSETRTIGYEVTFRVATKPRRWKR